MDRVQITAGNRRIDMKPRLSAFESSQINENLRRIYADTLQVLGDESHDRVRQSCVSLIALDNNGRPNLRAATIAERIVEENDVAALVFHGDTMP